MHCSHRMARHWITSFDETTVLWDGLTVNDEA